MCEEIDRPDLYNENAYQAQCREINELKNNALIRQKYKGYDGEIQKRYELNKNEDYQLYVYEGPYLKFIGRFYTRQDALEFSEDCYITLHKNIFDKEFDDYVFD